MIQTILTTEMQADRSIIIAAVSHIIYPIIRKQYFPWLDNNGHYAYYDLVVEIVDEMMFEAGSLYLAFMEKKQRGDQTDFNEFSGDCFDWYYMGKSEKMLPERLKGWEGSDEE
jgi:hypothetical protein